jgi:phosphoribosylformimino-5-aminoimidazole carboxamide ribotide isomerase
MRIIPVIDLLNGQVVHAIKGERAHYQPVRSVLCDASDPRIVAQAFHAKLGIDEIYVADLNAIQNSGQTNHSETIAGIIRDENIKIILDAGISEVESIQDWLDLGVHKVIIGSETLRTLDSLKNITNRIDPLHLIFSLDFRSGKILSQCPDLTTTPPMEALKWLQTEGWQEVLLLDLHRVGSSSGTDRTLAAEARKNCPNLRLLIGGGVTLPEELVELASLGFAGVLLATALHNGRIRAEHLRFTGAAS